MAGNSQIDVLIYDYLNRNYGNLKQVLPILKKKLNLGRNPKPNGKLEEIIILHNNSKKIQIFPRQDADGEVIKNKRKCSDAEVENPLKKFRACKEQATSSDKSEHSQPMLPSKEKIVKMNDIANQKANSAQGQQKPVIKQTDGQKKIDTRKNASTSVLSMSTKTAKTRISKKDNNSSSSILSSSDDKSEHEQPMLLVKEKIVNKKDVTNKNEMTLNKKLHMPEDVKRDSSFFSGDDDSKHDLPKQHIAQKKGDTNKCAKTSVSSTLSTEAPKTNVFEKDIDSSCSLSSDNESGNEHPNKVTEQQIAETINSAKILMIIEKTDSSKNDVITANKVTKYADTKSLEKDFHCQISFSSSDDESVMHKPKELKINSIIKDIESDGTLPSKVFFQNRQKVVTKRPEAQRKCDKRIAKSTYSSSMSTKLVNTTESANCRKNNDSSSLSSTDEESDRGPQKLFAKNADASTKGNANKNAKASSVLTKSTKESKNDSSSSSSLSSSDDESEHMRTKLPSKEKIVERNELDKGQQKPVTKVNSCTVTTKLAKTIPTKNDNDSSSFSSSDDESDKCQQKPVIKNAVASTKVNANTNARASYPSSVVTKSTKESKNDNDSSSSSDDEFEHEQTKLPSKIKIVKKNDIANKTEMTLKKKIDLPQKDVESGSSSSSVDDDSGLEDPKSGKIQIVSQNNENSNKSEDTLHSSKRSLNPINVNLLQKYIDSDNSLSPSYDDYVTNIPKETDKLSSLTKEIETVASLTSNVNFSQKQHKPVVKPDDASTKGNSNKNARASYPSSVSTKSTKESKIDNDSSCSLSSSGDESEHEQTKLPSKDNVAKRNESDKGQQKPVIKVNSCIAPTKLPKTIPTEKANDNSSFSSDTESDHEKTKLSAKENAVKRNESDKGQKKPVIKNANASTKVNANKNAKASYSSSVSTKSTKESKIDNDTSSSLSDSGDESEHEQIKLPSKDNVAKRNESDKGQQKPVIKNANASTKVNANKNAKASYSSSVSTKSTKESKIDNDTSSSLSDSSDESEHEQTKLPSKDNVAKRNESDKGQQKPVVKVNSRIAPTKLPKTIPTEKANDNSSFSSDTESDHERTKLSAKENAVKRNESDKGQQKPVIKNANASTKVNANKNAKASYSSSVSTKSTKESKVDNDSSSSLSSSGDESDHDKTKLSAIENVVKRNESDKGQQKPVIKNADASTKVNANKNAKASYSSSVSTKSTKESKIDNDTSSSLSDSGDESEHEQTKLPSKDNVSKRNESDKGQQKPVVKVNSCIAPAKLPKTIPTEEDNDNSSFSSDTESDHEKTKPSAKENAVKRNESDKGQQKPVIKNANASTKVNANKNAKASYSSSVSTKSTKESKVDNDSSSSLSSSGDESDHDKTKLSAIENVVRRNESDKGQQKPVIKNADASTKGNSNKNAKASYPSSVSMKFVKASKNDNDSSSSLSSSGDESEHEQTKLPSKDNVAKRNESDKGQQKPVVKVNTCVAPTKLPKTIPTEKDNNSSSFSSSDDESDHDQTKLSAKENVKRNESDKGQHKPVIKNDNASTKVNANKNAKASYSSSVSTKSTKESKVDNDSSSSLSSSGDESDHDKTKLSAIENVVKRNESDKGQQKPVIKNADASTKGNSNKNAKASYPSSVSMKFVKASKNDNDSSSSLSSSGDESEHEQTKLPSKDNVAKRNESDKGQQKPVVKVNSCVAPAKLPKTIPTEEDNDNSSFSSDTESDHEKTKLSAIENVVKRNESDKGQQKPVIKNADASTKGNSNKNAKASYPSPVSMKFVKASKNDNDSSSSLSSSGDESEHEQTKLPSKDNVAKRNESDKGQQKPVVKVNSCVAPTKLPKTIPTEKDNNSSSFSSSDDESDHDQTKLSAKENVVKRNESDKGQHKPVIKNDNASTKVNANKNAKASYSSSVSTKSTKESKNDNDSSCSLSSSDDESDHEKTKLSAKENAGKRNESDKGQQKPVVKVNSCVAPTKLPKTIPTEKDNDNNSFSSDTESDHDQTKLSAKENVVKRNESDKGQQEPVIKNADASTKGNATKNAKASYPSSVSMKFVKASKNDNDSSSSLSSSDDESEHEQTNLSSKEKIVKTNEIANKNEMALKKNIDLHQQDFKSDSSFSSFDDDSDQDQHNCAKNLIFPQHIGNANNNSNLNNLNLHKKGVDHDLSFSSDDSDDNDYIKVKPKEASKLDVVQKKDGVNISQYLSVPCNDNRGSTNLIKESLIINSTELGCLSTSVDHTKDTVRNSISKVDNIKPSDKKDIISKLTQNSDDAAANDKELPTEKHSDSFFSSSGDEFIHEQSKSSLNKVINQESCGEIKTQKSNIIKNDNIERYSSADEKHLAVCGQNNVPFSEVSKHCMENTLAGKQSTCNPSSKPKIDGPRKSLVHKKPINPSKKSKSKIRNPKSSEFVDSDSSDDLPNSSMNTEGPSQLQSKQALSKVPILNTNPHFKPLMIPVNDQQYSTTDDEDKDIISKAASGDEFIHEQSKSSLNKVINQESGGEIKTQKSNIIKNDNIERYSSADEKHLAICAQNNMPFSEVSKHCMEKTLAGKQSTCNPSSKPKIDGPRKSLVHKKPINPPKKSKSKIRNPKSSEFVDSDSSDDLPNSSMNTEGPSQLQSKQALSKVPILNTNPHFKPLMIPVNDQQYSTTDDEDKNIISKAASGDEFIHEQSKSSLNKVINQESGGEIKTQKSNIIKNDNIERYSSADEKHLAMCAQNNMPFSEVSKHCMEKTLAGKQSTCNPSSKPKIDGPRKSLVHKKPINPPKKSKSKIRNPKSSEFVDSDSSDDLPNSSMNTEGPSQLQSKQALSKVPILNTNPHFKPLMIPVNDQQYSTTDDEDKDIISKAAVRSTGIVNEGVKIKHINSSKTKVNVRLESPRSNANVRSACNVKQNSAKRSITKDQQKAKPIKSDTSEFLSDESDHLCPPKKISKCSSSVKLREESTAPVKSKNSMSSLHELSEEEIRTPIISPKKLSANGVPPNNSRKRKHSTTFSDDSKSMEKDEAPILAKKLSSPKVLHREAEKAEPSKKKIKKKHLMDSISGKLGMSSTPINSCVKWSTPDVSIINCLSNKKMIKKVIGDKSTTLLDEERSSDSSTEDISKSFC